jgi:hypothetical protein
MSLVGSVAPLQPSRVVTLRSKHLPRLSYTRIAQAANSKPSYTSSDYYPHGYTYRHFEPEIYLTLGHLSPTVFISNPHDAAEEQGQGQR